MNLGKLLGAGKSFFGGHGLVKYREDKRVYLPKFNGESNPFAPRQSESLADPAKTQKIPEVSTKTQKIPVLSAAPRPARATSWKEKFNPFRAAEPANPPMVGAVQAELSLDAVRVIRNDLTDADIEVVPVKSQTVSMPETPSLPVDRSNRHAWEVMDGRAVRVG
jgi:hypothetical protein